MTTRLSSPKLETTVEALDKLHTATQGRGKVAKVPKADLEKLLVDHSRMAKLLGID